MERWMSSDKPQGLWVSVDDDWAEWCRGNHWRVDSLIHCYRLDVRPDRLLTLSTAEKIIEFQGHYGAPEVMPTFLKHGLHAIDWSKVAADHAGIVIAPYQWSLRHQLMWYYTWDCASGCIWDTSVIERVVRYPIGSEFVKGTICSTCEGDPYDTVSKTYCPTCQGTGAMP
jgi:hypothetical protein